MSKITELKGDYGGRTVFHFPETLIGDQYLVVFRILVHSQILVPIPISAKVKRHCLCSTD